MDADSIIDSAADPATVIELIRLARRGLAADDPAGR